MPSYVSKISTKGQIVIPASMQRELSLEDGVSVVIKVVGQSIVLEPSVSWVESTRGMLAAPHPPLEPDALEELIEATALIETMAEYGQQS